MKPSEIEYFMTLPYPILTVEREGRYVMEHPDLPGCSASGATAEEARAALLKSKRSWIETQAQKRLPVPSPRNLRDMASQYHNVFDAFKSELRTFAIVEGIESLPPVSATVEQIVKAIVAEAKLQGRRAVVPKKHKRATAKNI